MLQGRGGDKACVGDSGSPLMVFDTTKTPATWVHIGLVHGGVVCNDFYKALDFPEIFSRTEDAEVLDFIRVCQSMQEYARVCQSVPEYARVLPSFAFI